VRLTPVHLNPPPGAYTWVLSDDALMPELRARPAEFRRVNEVGPETEGKMLALRADGVYFVGNGLHVLEVVPTHIFTPEAERMYSLREKVACSDKGGGELFECQREYAALMAT
jgi:hypothetical protein